MQNRNTPRGTYYSAQPQRSAQPGANPQRTYSAPRQGTVQRPAAQRPAGQAPVRRGGGEPPKQPPTIGRAPGPSLLLMLIGLAVIAVIGGVMQFVLFPGGMKPQAQETTAVTEIVSSRGVRINEVMTANGIALSDEANEYPDWVELTNTSGKAMDLSGWSLTDKLQRTNHFVFPDGFTLNAGEYVVVFCSGRLSDDLGSTFHAPFKLSSRGDAVILTDEGGTVVESINVPALTQDYSYARRDQNTWEITAEYTPGLENSSLSYAALTTLDPVVNSPLRVSEVMPSNGSFIPCADGMYYDWIELYNSGNEAIDLAGYGLSDQEAKPSRWRFPSVTIGPGQYLVVYASGLDKVEGDELHTNFRLRAEGESVLLYNDRGQLMDYVTYDNMKKDQSYALVEGSMRVSASPTPGGANK